MGILHCAIFHHLIRGNGLKAVTLDKVSGIYYLCDCGAEYFEARHRIIRIG